jgi:hypothetical protein
MSASEAIELDLLGDPVSLVKDRWGRPKYTKTKENQRVVSMLSARGWTHARIAAYLRCDDKTLRKHFSRELEAGRDLVEGMAMEILLKKMVDGDRQATVKVLDMIDQGKAAVPPADKPAKPGKKELELVDAATGHKDTGWRSVLQ